MNPGTGIITTPGVARNVQDVPDLTGNIRYDGDYGHVQVAGIARKLTFQPATGDSALDEFGYGVNLTGTFHPWACLTARRAVGTARRRCRRAGSSGQFAAGRGINRYIQDVNGFGLDATFDPVNGFRTIPSYGWFVAYEQWWAISGPRTSPTARTTIDLTDTLPDNTYQRANYVSANLIWLPVERMGVGTGIPLRHRKNKDGQRGQAHRIQMGFQYRF